MPSSDKLIKTNPFPAKQLHRQEKNLQKGKKSNSDEPVELEQIEDLPNIPMRPDPAATKESTSKSTDAENQCADPALRARLKGLPGNYLWNLLLHYTFEDHPDELANFYSELEAEKAEIEAAKLEQEKQETNPIAA